MRTFGLFHLKLKGDTVGGGGVEVNPVGMTRRNGNTILSCKGVVGVAGSIFHYCRCEVLSGGFFLPRLHIPREIHHVFVPTFHFHIGYIVDIAHDACFTSHTAHTVIISSCCQIVFIANFGNDSHFFFFTMFGKGEIYKSTRELFVHRLGQIERAGDCSSSIGRNVRGDGLLKTPLRIAKTSRHKQGIVGGDE